MYPSSDLHRHTHIKGIIDCAECIPHSASYICLWSQRNIVNYSSLPRPPRLDTLNCAGVLGYMNSLDLQ